MRRFLIFILLYLLLLPALSGGENFYEAQLNRGIRNSPAYSSLLIQQAHEKGPEATKILQKAITYSPDLPKVYFEMSWASFSLSYSGILSSVDYIVQGINAYSRNFWWSFTLTGSLFVSLILSFILAIAIIVFMRLLTDLPLISHDTRETTAKSFSLLLLLVISLLSPLWFFAGTLILLGFYMRKIDKLVVYLYLVFLVCSPVVFNTASLFMHTAASGKVKAAIRANEAEDNNYAMSVLKNDTDYVPLFSYALALKREGRYDDAILILINLAEKRPDPRVYVNLGNCFVGLYNFEEEKKYNLEEALKYYVMAANLRPLVSAYYNLSAVSREMLDFTKGDEYFQSALDIDRVAVTNFRAVSGRHPNRLVVDETLNFDDLWHYIREQNKQTSTFGMSVIPPPVLSIVSFLLLGAFYLLDRRLVHRAYRCRKCTSILCTKCEKRLMWGQMCPQCYKSLIKLDELDVRERVSRLLSIYDQQQKRRSTMKILSFVLPGMSQIYAGRILYGFLFLWPFLFFVFVPATIFLLMQGNSLLSHSFFSWISVFLAAVVYVLSNFITRQRISKGWR